MKKTTFLFLSFLLLCNFSYAQADTISDNKQDDKKLHSFSIEINPLKYLFNQYNLDIDYKISKKIFVDFYLSKVDSFTRLNGVGWTTLDASVSQYLSGYRFAFGVKKFENDLRQYKKISVDFSYKEGFNKEIHFAGPDESYHGAMLFNQKRLNIGLEAIYGMQCTFLKYFFLDIYVGGGLKYMHLETDRIKYWGKNGFYSENAKLLFNKSNYILPTLNLGLNIGFKCFKK